MLPSLLHVHACGLILIQEKKQEKQRKEERGREKKENVVHTCRVLGTVAIPLILEEPVD